MVFLTDIEKNFRYIKNKFIWNKSDKRFYIVKHTVYYCGINQIKLTFLEEEKLVEKIYTESEFKQFIINSTPKPKQKK